MAEYDGILALNCDGKHQKIQSKVEDKTMFLMRFTVDFCLFKVSKLSL